MYSLTLMEKLYPSIEILRPKYHPFDLMFLITGTQTWGVEILCDKCERHILRGTWDTSGNKTPILTPSLKKFIGADVT